VKATEMKRRRNEAEAFVGQIERLRFDNTFNPYAETCSLCDKPNAADLRRQNLRKVLNAVLENGVESVWIARDLGYRGGRRTGLALTDEVHLSAHANLLKSGPLQRATKGPAVSERTALVVWRMLLLINAPVFLWNIFPLHPHEPHEPLSNRNHTRAERTACQPLLLWILQRLNPKRVIAIGRDAKLALDGMDAQIIAVRHPSYGGQSEFVHDIAAIYRLPSYRIAGSAQLPML
jgi:uracil-DNA glycosylase